MAEYLSRSPLLRLPLELRDQIYGYLLPDVDEICIKPGFKENVYHEGDIEWFDRFFDLRRDGDSCYPAVLAVNKQVNTEASRIMWNRIYTITVSPNCIEFLGVQYPIAPYSQILSTGLGPRNQLPNQLHAFPVAFPFHRARALRVGVMNTEFRARIDQEQFELQLKELSQVLGKIGQKDLPLKKLMIDLCAWGDGPHFTDLADITKLFRAFEHCEKIAKFCEVKLGDWVMTSPEVILMARTLGHRIIYRPPLDELQADNTATLASGKCRATSEPDQDSENLILLAQEWLCGCGEENKLLCTEWDTRMRRL